MIHITNDHIHFDKVYSGEEDIHFFFTYSTIGNAPFTHTIWASFIGEFYQINWSMGVFKQGDFTKKLCSEAEILTDYLIDRCIPSSSQLPADEAARLKGFCRECVVEWVDIIAKTDGFKHDFVQSEMEAWV